MNVNEYAIMRSVEDRHWWYVGLRGVLGVYWNRFVTTMNPRILDAGCGTGAGLEWLAPRSRPVGIDFAREAISFCRQRGAGYSLAASVNELPFAPGAFDVVISCDVLCHRSIRDKQAPLREFHRVLRPGGLVMLNLPAYAWLRSSHDTAVQTDHRFTKTEVGALLRPSGFEPLAGTYWNTLLFAPIALLRLWRRVRPPAESDLSGHWDGVPNALCSRLMAVERLALQHTILPFGVSVFVVARRV